MNKTLTRLCSLAALAMALIGNAAQAGQGSAAAAANALKQDAACTRCHDEGETKPLLSIYQTKHGVKADERTPTCQSCHGKSEQHIAGGAAVGEATRPAPDINFKTKTTVTPGSAPHTLAQACVACHKGGQRTHWDSSAHESRDVVCSNCHSVHVKRDAVLSKATQPEVCFGCHKSERAQTHKLSSHPLGEGKMSCSDCHNPHGTVGPKLLTKNSVTDTCYTCHAEKRGPFLWEHQPVSEDCSTCHTPHGSSTAPLLKQRTPWLCQDCHTGDHAAQVNSGANLAGGAVTTVNGNFPLANAPARAQLGARNCLNCHVMVHGSNHPGGAKYFR